MQQLKQTGFFVLAGASAVGALAAGGGLEGYALVGWLGAALAHSGSGGVGRFGHGL